MSRPPISAGVPEGDEPPVDHDRDAVGQRLRLVHEVGGEEDGLAERAEVLDRRPGLAAGGRVEAGGRLVEEEQVGVADEREREVEAAPLAAREQLDARALLAVSPTSSTSSSTGRRRG